MAKLTKQSNGYYRAWYRGKRFQGRTPEEAIAKRDTYKYECEHGIERPQQITVIELAEEWLSSKAGIERTTYNQYVTIMEKMTDIIGDKLVSAVTPADIKRVWKQYDSLSQSYINKAKFLYKGFFQYAIDNRYCQTSPLLSSSAKPHKGTKGTHRCLTKTEIHLVETVPHRVQAAAMIMMKAGLRRGEILALSKADIHDDRIYINKSVKFVNNRPVVGSTKNESSERNVPVFAPLKPFIEPITDLILPDANGAICTETAFQRAWESYMRSLSVAANQKISFRPHDLRHTFVTICRDKGIDIKTCMKWCGHASERMILEIYDHPSADREAAAISLMDE